MYPPVYPNGLSYNENDERILIDRLMDHQTNQLSMEQVGTLVILNSKQECFDKIFLPAYLCSNSLDCIAAKVENLLFETKLACNNLIKFRKIYGAKTHLFHHA